MEQAKVLAEDATAYEYDKAPVVKNNVKNIPEKSFDAPKSKYIEFIKRKHEIREIEQNAVLERMESKKL